MRTETTKTTTFWRVTRDTPGVKGASSTPLMTREAVENYIAWAEGHDATNIQVEGHTLVETVVSAVSAEQFRAAGRPEHCGQGWVAEIELCYRCGLSAAEHPPTGVIE